jgi:hypothetical protein
MSACQINICEVKLTLVSLTTGSYNDVTVIVLKNCDLMKQKKTDFIES